MPSLSFPPLGIIALAVMTASGYAVATVGLKLASDGHYTTATPLIVAGFVAAIYAEIMLLRQFDLSMIYIMIIALETLLIVGFAVCIGELPSTSQILGGALVLCGLALTVA
ncbi:MAG: 5-aminolevulinate synthase [Octadecabacter sp.]|nr:5-aminolevulinate synthase [Octadecabacter sp.]